jgi:LAO/AO transport system kinase
MMESGELEDRRKKQAIEWMWSLLQDGLKERFFKRPEIKKMLPELKQNVERGIISPSAAVNKLFLVLEKS